MGRSGPLGGPARDARRSVADEGQDEVLGVGDVDASRVVGTLAVAVVEPARDCGAVGFARRDRQGSPVLALEHRLAFLHEGAGGLAVLLGHAAARVVPGLEVEELREAPALDGRPAPRRVGRQGPRPASWLR